jgi:hypothetical protein
MDIRDPKIRYAVSNTKILRAPEQTLATFGLTSIHYYLLTEPVYLQSDEEINETVIREGKVISQRPRVVTPNYMNRLEGFGPNAKKYLEEIARQIGYDAPGLFYNYKNEQKNLNIVNGGLRMVSDKINQELDERKEKLAAIIKGEDELWDVSLLKFIYELTANSITGNLMQLGSRGLLRIDAEGIPMDARMRIEEQFGSVIRGDSSPAELKDELERWNLFEEYQDRFFRLFKKK